MYQCSLDISPSETGLWREKYDSLGHAVDRSVYGMPTGVSFAPLLHHDRLRISRFWSLKTMALLIKKIAVSFEDA